MAGPIALAAPINDAAASPRQAGAISKFGSNFFGDSSLAHNDLFA
jgi:hypothetical protein